MNFKKAGTIVLALVSFVLMISCFTACAKSDVEIIRDSIAEKLDGIKSLDSDFVEEFSADMDIDTLASYGVDGIEFMKAYFNGFDYSIDNIEIDGDDAIAVVTIKCKSFSEYQDTLSDAVTNLYSNDEIWSMTEDELSAYLGALIMDCIDSVKVTSAKPFTIDYTKDNNVWVSSEDSMNSIIEVLLSN